MEIVPSHFHILSSVVQIQNSAAQMVQVTTQVHFDSIVGNIYQLKQTPQVEEFPPSNVDSFAEILQFPCPKHKVYENKTTIWI
jgi:hypothetical protein